MMKLENHDPTFYQTNYQNYLSTLSIIMIIKIIKIIGPYYPTFYQNLSNYDRVLRSWAREFNLAQFRGFRSVPDGWLGMVGHRKGPGRKEVFFIWG